MPKTKKQIPAELYEQTAREEGWVPVGECTITEMRNQPIDVVESVIKYGKPEYFNRDMGEFANAAHWMALCGQQQITVFDESFRIPTGLTEEAARLAREFRQFVVNYHQDEDGLYRCGTTFRSPSHQAQFEEVNPPATAMFAVIFDGGPVAPLMNLSYENYKGFDATMQFFSMRGYWFENVTHWWAWVMKND